VKARLRKAATTLEASGGQQKRRRLKVNLKNTPEIKRTKRRKISLKTVEKIRHFYLTLNGGEADSREWRQNLISFLCFKTSKTKCTTCYVIIELKTKDFEPEFVGKLNFYITTVNELVRDDHGKNSRNTGRICRYGFLLPVVERY
jgi:hypothetical protein